MALFFPLASLGTVATGIPLRRGNLLGRTDAPEGVAVDSLGNLYIADTGASVVRVVNLTGKPETLPGNTPLPVGGIATIAGISPVNGFGNAGFSGDGGPATQAQLYSPNALAVDTQGDLFIADSNLNEIREVADPFGTSAVTLPGGNGTLQPGYIGMVAGGAANPEVGVTAFALDGNGNLYFSDIQYTLGELNLSTGQISNVPLTPPAAYAQNNLPGIGGAFGMAADAAGNVYYADSYNNVVLECSPNSNTTSIVAGEPGQAGYSGDNQPAASSLLSFPTGLALAPDGAIYVADAGNSRVREVEPPSPFQVIQSLTPQDGSDPLILAVEQAPNVTLQVGVQGQSPDQDELDAVATAVAGLGPQTPNVTITVNVAQPAAMENYGDAGFTVPAGVTVIINGQPYQGGPLVPWQGNSPAITLISGTLEVTGFSIATATDDPAIRVEGGTLILRNDDIIQESTDPLYTGPAIEIDGGGAVDLGNANQLGGDTIDVDGSGPFFSGGGAVSAGGDTFEVNEQAIPVLSSMAADLTPPTTAVEAAFGPLTVLHFTDVNPYTPTEDFVATVNTGDATLDSTDNPDNVQVVADSRGGFDVQLSYTYLETLSGVAFSVSVSDPNGDATSQSSNNFSVAAAVIATGASPIATTYGSPVGGPAMTLATFIDPAGAGPSADYSAAIDWGDRSATQAGTVTYVDATGSFAVTSPAHDYNAGPYTLTVTIDREGVLSTATTQVLVCQAPLTVTANNVSKVYGTPNPTFSVSDNGFVTGDGAQLGGTLTFSTAATITSPVGAYSVTPGGLTSPNYAITFVPGTLTVTTLAGSIYVLDPTAGGALALSGSAGINTSGNVVVDSTSSSAILASGNATVTAATVQVEGGVGRSGNAKLTKTGTPGASGDPLAGLPIPVASTLGLANKGSLSLGGNAKQTIVAGVYSQISVSGNASLTLSPGIYIIAGGGFAVSGNGNVAVAGAPVH